MNKTSSAVHLQLDLDKLDLTDWQREKILKHRDKRISDNGLITIKAQSQRTQIRNRADALERLKKLLQAALHVEPPRRATRPSYGSVKRRLKKKNERGQIKAMRGKVRDYD